MSLPLSTLTQTQTEKPALATGRKKNMMTMRVTLKYEATLPSPPLKLGPCLPACNDWLFFCFPLWAWLSGEGRGEVESLIGSNQQSASVNCADKNI